MLVFTMLAHIWTKILKYCALVVNISYLHVTKNFIQIDVMTGVRNKVATECICQTKWLQRPTAPKVGNQHLPLVVSQGTVSKFFFSVYRFFME